MRRTICVTAPVQRLHRREVRHHQLRLRLPGGQQPLAGRSGREEVQDGAGSVCRCARRHAGQADRHWHQARRLPAARRRTAPYSMQVTKNYITFLGLTDDRRKVVLADNRWQQGGRDQQRLHLCRQRQRLHHDEPHRVVDYCNLDYEYPGDPRRTSKCARRSSRRRVVIQMPGDKHVYSHVAFLSRLDTTVLSHHAGLLHQRLHRGHRRLYRPAAERSASSRTPRFTSQPAAA